MTTDSTPLIETLERAARIVRSDYYREVAEVGGKDTSQWDTDARRLRELASAFETIEERREEVFGIFPDKHSVDECWTACLEKRSEYDSRAVDADTLADVILALATLLSEETP